MGMMSQIAEHVWMDYRVVLDSRYVAQSANNFLFPCEEERSVDDPITIEEDQGFSEPGTSVSEPSTQPPAMEARPASRSIEKLQSFENSVARQLLDL